MKNLKYIALLCVTVILTSCGRDFWNRRLRTILQRKKKMNCKKILKLLQI